MFVSRFATSCGVTILVSLACASDSFAQSNPQPAAYPIDFADSNGKLWKVSVTVANAYWDVDLNPWDGKVTSAGRRIEHSDNHGNDFPISVGGVTITAAMVNSRWDDYYNCPGYTQRKSDPTLSSNCHGHSLRKGYWINWTDGGERVAQDDFTTATDKCGKNYAHKFSSVDHSELLLECCTANSMPDTIRKYSQKNNTSGTYESPLMTCPTNLSTTGDLVLKPN